MFFRMSRFLKFQAISVERVLKCTKCGTMCGSELYDKIEVDSFARNFKLAIGVIVGGQG